MTRYPKINWWICLNFAMTKKKINPNVYGDPLTLLLEAPSGGTDSCKIYRRYLCATDD